MSQVMSGRRPRVPISKVVAVWAFTVELAGVPNVFVATGHGGYGLEVGPYSGALLAELILGRPLALDLEPFAPGRFAHARHGLPIS